MAYSQPASRRGARRTAHNPLIGPLALFVAVLIGAVGYVGYVLWPRWPEPPVPRDAPPLPIVISDVTFNIAPAAIRRAVERHAGRERRVDLVYLWPSLQPPDRSTKPRVTHPIDLDKRLFVTIAVHDGTLPLMQRVREIYPRYLAPGTIAGPSGLTLRAFRAGTPYQGEELVYETKAPTHFLARCTRHGVANDGNCLLQRRIGGADITFRFPRHWLAGWQSVAAGIDRLLAKLHTS